MGKKFLVGLIAVMISMAVIKADESQAQKEQAAQALEQAVKTAPNNAELWVHLGFAYRKTNDMAKSKDAFEKAISIDPKNQDALFMLGLIYENNKQTADALRVWKQFLESNPDPSKREVAENHIHHLSR